MKPKSISPTERAILVAAYRYFYGTNKGITGQDATPSAPDEFRCEPQNLIRLQEAVTCDNEHHGWTDGMHLRWKERP